MYLLYNDFCPHRKEEVDNIIYTNNVYVSLARNFRPSVKKTDAYSILFRNMENRLAYLY